MPRATTHYGKIVLRGAEDEPVFHTKITRPVDDLLAWDLPHTPERTAQWVITYGAGADFLPAGDAAREKAIAGVLRWRKRGIPDLFLRAARKASKGKFPREIVPYLERVTFRPDGSVEFSSDFLALAAWALDRAMREYVFTVRKCELCGVPFLATPRSRYCQRLAPGSSKQSCLSAGRLRDFRTRQKRAQQRKEGAN